MSAKESIENILKDLNNILGIEATAVITRDGLLMSSTMAKSADTFAAMSATMFGAAKIAAIELGKGIPNRVIVETKNGKLIATGAGSKTLLVVMARNDSSLGEILFEMTKASEKMIEVFKDTSLNN